MKLGLMLGYSGAQLDLPVELVQRAETLGFDSVFTERREALQQLDRLEQELRRPVRPGAPQGELDLAVVGEFEAVVRHGRPQGIAGDTL